MFLPNIRMDNDQIPDLKKKRNFSSIDSKELDSRIIALYESKKEIKWCPDGGRFFWYDTQIVSSWNGPFDSFIEALEAAVGPIDTIPF